MGKKLDKKAKAAVAKAAKGVKAAKVDKAVKKFRKLEGKLWTREYLLKIAEFDGATIAPANGAAARADAMGTLAGEHHKLLTSEKSVELVRSLARETVAGGHVDDPQLLDEIRVLGRDQREASVIPTEEAEAWTRLTCEADAVWHKAKTANDWASFEPYVDRIVAQLKHQAELMDPKRDPYDVWLDQYERGLSAKSFDGRGNFSMGVTEQLIFPEIDFDSVDHQRGMDITFVTTANTDEEAKALLDAFGFPFKK